MKNICYEKYCEKPDGEAFSPSEIFLPHAAVGVGKNVEISVGPLTGNEEIHKFHRENIAEDKIRIFVIVKSYVAGSHMEYLSLLAMNSVRSDEKFYNNIVADIF